MIELVRKCDFQIISKNDKEIHNLFKIDEKNYRGFNVTHFKVDLVETPNESHKILEFPSPIIKGLAIYVELKEN